jgi:MFS family permease
MYTGFYINVPIGGVVGAIILAIAIPEKSRPEVGFKRFQALDLPGFAMLAPTVVMFLLALEWGGQSYRWNSATIIGLFCGSFGLLCVFLAWENHQGDAAMIPLSIVRHRIVTFSGIFTLFIMGHMVVFSYYLPTWFQVVLNATPTMSGVMLLPTILSQILGVVISGLFGESNLSFNAATTYMPNANRNQFQNSDITSPGQSAAPHSPPLAQA